MKTRKRSTEEAQVTHSVVERYQWLRNKEASQKFGSQTVIAELSQELFEEHVLPRLRDDIRAQVPTLADFLRRWPTDTHLRLLSSEGRWAWSFDGIGSAHDLRPHGRQLLWATKVKSFDSVEARAWGATADSDLYRRPAVTRVRRTVSARPKRRCL